MNKKLTSRQVQAQNTQDKIYKVAVDLIQKKGFQNITVDEICKAAGVSVGSFYNSFKSKNQILDRIFKLADDYFQDVVAVNIVEGPAKDRIVKFFDYYATYNLERGLDFVKQLYTVKNNLFATKGRHMQSVLEKVIEEGQQRGELSTEMTPNETVIFLFIAVRGVVYDWCLHDGKYDLSKAINSYVTKLLKAIVI